MKKILSILITISILASFFALPVYAQTVGGTPYEMTIAEETLAGLGVISPADYNPDTYVSRADFAVMMSRLCGFVPENRVYDDAMDFTFGNDASNEVILSDSRQLFVDVDKTIPEYEEINAMCINGYMNGISDTHFAPYYDMTLDQVLKVVVSMLGYDTLAIHEGGYPHGYTSVAARLKLTSGIGSLSDRYVTYGAICNILYNAFDVEVIELSSIGADGAVDYQKSGETFLSACADIKRIAGSMTDNGISTFYGSSKVASDCVVIDGVELAIGADPRIRAYLGRYVDAFYRENASGKKMLLYAIPTGDDRAVTFDINDFAGYNSSSISYYAGDKKVTKNLSSGLKVIYNYEVLKSYDASTFDFLFGEVTLASTGGSGYDVLVINDYMVAKVKKKDSARNVLYSETLYTNMNGVKTVEISADSGTVVTISDVYGSPMSFEAIAPGSIISVIESGNNSYTGVRVCASTVKNFEAKTVSTSSGGLEISDGVNAYTLRGADYLDPGFVVRAGEIYDLYFDYKGNLIWVESITESTDFATGILLDAADTGNGLSDGYAVKLYTSEGEFGVYKLADRLSVNHESVSAHKAFADFLTSDEYRNDAVLYRADDKGYLRAIVLPLSYGEQDTDNRGWYQVSPQVRLSRYEGETDAQWKEYFDSEDVVKYVRSEQGNSLNRFMMYDKSIASVYTVPSREEHYNDSKRFSVNVMSPKATQQLINMYDREQNPIAPKTLIMSASGGADGGEVTNTRAFLITKASKSVNEDGEDISLLSGYLLDLYASGTSATNLTLDEEVVFIDIYNGREGKYSEGHDKYDDDFPVLDSTEPEYDFDLDGPASPDELEPGDIIRYETNEEGKVSRIRMAYDMSEDKTYVSGKRIQTDYWSHNFWYGYTFRGYPMSVQNNKFIRLSADEPHNVDIYDTDYVMSSDNVVVHEVNTKTLVVEKTPGGIAVRTGVIEDITSHEESGDLASGEYSKVVALSYMAMPIGTVIYK